MKLGNCPVCTIRSAFLRLTTVVSSLRTLLSILHTWIYINNHILHVHTSFAPLIPLEHKNSPAGFYLVLNKSNFTADSFYGTQSFNSLSPSRERQCSDTVAHANFHSHVRLLVGISIHSILFMWCSWPLNFCSFSVLGHVLPSESTSTCHT